MKKVVIALAVFACMVYYDQLINEIGERYSTGYSWAKILTIPTYRSYIAAHFPQKVPQ